MSNVKFKYLGDTSKAYTNVITVVSYLYKLEDIYYINFGYSFSNKKDKYNKTLGKLKALENKKYTVEIGRCKPNFLQIDDIIFKHILLDEKRGEGRIIFCCYNFNFNCSGISCNWSCMGCC